jgi:pimeloyl-ACP methyl ester carboxylesterase
MMEAASDRWITLRDGRRLGFAEYGDPQGRPLLYFHGFPASRLEAALTDAAAARLGLRVITIDRPGIGLSDFLAGRTIADWPQDVVELADALRLQRFAVLGVSGGGPYALACAAEIPSRLSAVGIVGGLGPVAAAESTVGMAALNRFFLCLFRHASWLGRPLFALVAKGIRRWPERFFAFFTATVPVADRKALDRPDIRRLFHASMREGFRQGARGAARELLLYSRPWNFAPAQIPAEVHLWHGELDVTVPAAMGRRLAATLPHCRARFLPEEGHFSLPLIHMEKILSTLAESDQPVGTGSRPNSPTYRHD